jgi:hypothetical protein
MANLSQHARTPHSPSPIYGVAPGFTVGDLDRAYTPSIPVLYGTLVTYPGTSLTPNWDPGTVATQATVNSNATVQPNARAVKIAVNVSGTGSIVLTVKSNADSYTATIATYSGLTAGGYQFYLGGYGSKAEFSPQVGEAQTDLASNPAQGTDPATQTTQPGQNDTLYPTSDGSSYISGLTQYGPSTTNGVSQETNPYDPSINPGGFDPAQSNENALNPATDNNFFGQTYNPFQFLSLDGYALKFTAVVTGTVGYDVEVMPIS